MITTVIATFPCGHKIRAYSLSPDSWRGVTHKGKRPALFQVSVDKVNFLPEDDKALIDRTLVPSLGPGGKIMVNGNFYYNKQERHNA